jgi:hypothetical protein
MRELERLPELGVVDANTALWAYSVLPKAGFNLDALVAIVHDIRDLEFPRESDSDGVWYRAVKSVLNNAINDDVARDRAFERIARKHFGTWRLSRVRWLVVHLTRYQTSTVVLEFFAKPWRPALRTDFEKRRRIEGLERAEIISALGYEQT